MMMLYWGYSSREATVTGEGRETEKEGEPIQRDAIPNWPQVAANIVGCLSFRIFPEMPHEVSVFQSIISKGGEVRLST